MLQIIIDNMIFNSREERKDFENQKKIMDAQVGLLFFFIKILISLLFLAAMITGWCVQKLLIKIFKPQNAFTNFALIHKFPRFVIGAPTLYGIWYVAAQIQLMIDQGAAL